METPAPNLPSNGEAEPKLKIYFLPNLLTAANLFCGFVALTKIVEADISGGDFQQIKVALGFILLACIFDLFDGRVARMGGVESPFGREFDSLADLISFGAAPAFLVHRVVLKDVFEGHPEWGWFIASIYLLCGAFRLARFNCLSAMRRNGSEGVSGLPDPVGGGPGGLADAVHDLVGREGLRHRQMAVLLPVLLLFLSWMMVSNVRYPELQDAGFAGDPDLYQDAGGHPVPRQHPDLPGEDPRVRAAGVFHRLPDLRVYSAADFTQDAARD